VSQAPSPIAHLPDATHHTLLYNPSQMRFQLQFKNSNL
jgi:hypothetical protein